MHSDYMTSVDSAAAAVGRLLDPPPLTESESVEALIAIERLAASVEAARAEVLARFDRARSCESDGARSTAAWLRWRCRIPAGRATRHVSNARLLRDEPALAGALGGGDISADHLKPLADARSTNPVAFAGGGADHLLGSARTKRFDDFARDVRIWQQLVEPDGAEGDARADHEQRRAHCSRTWKGMRQLDALFDVIGGETFGGELERLERQLFDHDWADARTRIGDDVTVADLARTPAQRRLDALVEMATRSASYRDGMGRARPLLTVLVDYETLAGRVCELASGVVVTPGQVASLLAEADVERVVFGPASRVLDVGVRRRFFAGATRRACEVRDRSCVHPTCDTPAARCEIDHVAPFDGSNTHTANGECLCRWHHARKHRTDPQRRRHPPPPDDG